MKKTVVIYESKYGFTKVYAKRIARELSCPVFERKNFQPRDLTKYDQILYGGGLYAGGVSGIKLLTKNEKCLAGRRIILFTCGLADPANPENTAHIREELQKVLSPQLLSQITLFHLRGGIDYSRLNFVHRAMMSMLRKMLLKKEPHELSSEDKLLLQTYGQSIDYTDPESIKDLLEKCR